MGAFPSVPPARATTLVRPGSYSWYCTRKPHPSSRRPACCAQSRSRPGGLIVSKRRSVRVRATASLMPAIIQGAPTTYVARPRQQNAGSALVDNGDADPTARCGVRPVGDHIERLQKDFQRRRFRASEPGVDLLGRDMQESREARPPTEDLAGAGKDSGVTGALVH